MPFEPLVFGYDGIFEHIERLPDEQRRLEDLLERRSRTRIEVEMKIIGPIDVVAARVPLVEVDASEIDDPEQRGDILNHREIDDVARVVLDRAGLQP